MTPRIVLAGALVTAIVLVIAVAWLCLPIGTDPEVWRLVIESPR